jgi:hypothetical protein
LIAATACAAPVSDGGRARDQAALKPFAPLVGAWRGTGQVRRGSAKGAWTESAQWAWTLDQDHAALVLKLDGGKHLKQAVLRPLERSTCFELTATLADGTTRTFRGTADERDSLQLVADPPVDSGLARLTIVPLHENRTLIRLEAATTNPDQFEKLGEVGYTREGARFAVGDSSPECIVTGGRGTIAVQHQGKTYYVCCTGCRELFDDDPDAILAEYQSRRPR